MSRLKEAALKVWPIVRFLLTHKATYRFLGVLLGAFGVYHSDTLADSLISIATAIFGDIE